MTKVDQFESVFRAAEREFYRYEPVALASVLVVTDMPAAEAEAYKDELVPLLEAIWRRDTVEWKVLSGGDFHDVETLLAGVEATAPDLICTYRNLRTDAWKYPYSLGVYLDVLTQATATPVLVLPHPRSDHDYKSSLAKPDHVMAITDHLAGDARLVNYAVSFTTKGGKLYLTHIEDERAFEHIMTAISKLPSIDTAAAREDIAKQLIKDPHLYVSACRQALEEAKLPLKVEEIVTFGHHLARYKKFVDHHDIDLLVMNSKDEDQLAMHGVAYPLAVELRQVPLLLL